MYRVTQATIVKDGKPIKSYSLDTDTEDLDAVRKKVKKMYTKKVINGLEVDLQYTEISK